MSASQTPITGLEVFIIIFVVCFLVWRIVSHYYRLSTYQRHKEQKAAADAAKAEAEAAKEEADRKAEEESKMI